MSPLLLLAALSAPATATQELPAIPEDLLNVAAVSCVKMDDSGKVTGAYIVRSTGDAARDAEVIAWVKQLHWDRAKSGDKRNVWFPMPVSFGDVPAIPMPESCSPVEKPD